jgi:glycosyltransferase involved in cell wall biosynthesis
MMVCLSVIICSHNPREPYLTRVFEALRAQTLPREAWEFLLVDNKSAEPLSGHFDLTWHPNGRHVREDELGVTPARLRGIAEAKGDVIVFVDDDNVLIPSYLTEAMAIGERYTFLGAWGGSILPEFEAAPPCWVLDYTASLACRTIQRPRWSNVKSDWQSQPIGAGLCVRRTVCHQYSRQIAASSMRRSMDRKGSGLMSGGDLDLVMAGADLDLGWGNFPQLTLTHLIPATRIEERYLLRLHENIAASSTMLAVIHGYPVPPIDRWRFQLQWLWRLLRYGPRTARFLAAERRGVERGFRLVNSPGKAAAP